MLLGSDRDADSGGPARDEKGTGQSGDAGTQASWPRGLRGPRRWGGEPALRPGHDHTEPGYAPPVRVPQCRPLAFPRVFYPRSLKSQ
jgi:hypothetical protein